MLEAAITSEISVNYMGKCPRRRLSSSSLPSLVVGFCEPVMNLRVGCSLTSQVYNQPSIEARGLSFSAGVETSESRGGREEGGRGVLHVQHEGGTSEVSDNPCAREALRLG